MVNSTMPLGQIFAQMELIKKFLHRVGKLGGDFRPPSPVSCVCKVYEKKNSFSLSYHQDKFYRGIIHQPKKWPKIDQFACANGWTIFFSYNCHTPVTCVMAYFIHEKMQSENWLETLISLFLFTINSKTSQFYWFIWFVFSWDIEPVSGESFCCWTNIRLAFLIVHLRSEHVCETSEEGEEICDSWPGWQERWLVGDPPTKSKSSVVFYNVRNHLFAIFVHLKVYP